MTGPGADPAARRLAAAAAGLGAFAQLAQILVFREVMAVCHGTEILFGVILAAGLLWTALGTLVGAAYARRVHHDAARLAGALTVLAAVAGLLLAAQVLMARVLAGWGAVAAGEVASLSRGAALAVVVSGPASLAGGAIFALAIALVPGGRFALLYRAESWGAVVAGLTFTFLVVHVFDPLRAALAAGLLMILAAYLALRPLTGRRRTALAAGAAVTLILAALPLERPAEELRWRGLLPGYTLLESQDTPYGHVAALARPDSRQVNLYQSGSLVATLEPGAPPTASRALADLVACQHDAPRRALLVGGGLSTLPEELLRHGITAVDAVEQDPALFDAARRHGLPAADPPGVRRLAADGRTFLRTAAADAYDLILIAAGEPDTATVNRFYTRECFAACRRALTDRGVLIVLLPTYGGGTDYVGQALAGRTASIRTTFAAIFPEVRAAPVAGFLLAAAKAAGTVTFDPALLGRRLVARPQAAPMTPVETSHGIEMTRIPPEDYFTGLFGGVLAVRESLDGVRRQEPVQTLETALAAETHAAVNTDEHPAAVAESLILGAEVAGNGPRAGTSLAATLKQWRNATIAVPVAATLLAVGVLAILPQRRGPRPAVLLASFAAGLFGMAVQVALLAAYQNVRGYVYQEIGGITASFMVGLALGVRLGRPLAATRWRIIGVLAAMATMALAAPSAVRQLADLPSVLAAGGFWALVLLTGLLDGAAITALADFGRTAARDDAAPSGAGVYAADLGGAALGAMLAGAAWIPLFGMPGAAAATAAILVAAALAMAGAAAKEAA